MYVPECKFLLFDPISVKFVPKDPIRSNTYIASHNSLVSNDYLKQWGSRYWSTYVSLGFDELNVYFVSRLNK